MVSKEKEVVNKEEENGGGEDKKEEEPLVLKVDMHCEACARKVARSLKGFQGLFSSLYINCWLCQSIHTPLFSNLMLKLKK